MASYRMLLACYIHALSLSVTYCLHANTLFDTQAALDPKLLETLFPVSNLEKAQPHEEKRPLFGIIKELEDDLRKKSQHVGVPPEHLKEDMSSYLGAGNLDGIKAMALEKFQVSSMSRANSAVIEFALDKIGKTAGNADAMSTFRDFDALTSHMGVKGFAAQLAPLLTSRSPPNRKTMFDFAAQLLAKNGIPDEMQEYFHNFASMFKDPAYSDPAPSAFLKLVNQSKHALETMGGTFPNPMLSDRYKKTQNSARIIFRLPCEPDICFSLEMVLYISKNGPGRFLGEWGSGPPGSADPAFQMGFYTKDVAMRMPFFYTEGNRAVGIETEFLPHMKARFPKEFPEINVELKIRDSVFPSCCSHGEGTEDDPHMLGCHYLYFNVLGGDRIDLDVGTLVHTANQRNPFHFLLFANALTYSGSIPYDPSLWKYRSQSNFTLRPLASRGYTGFYKNMDWTSSVW